MTNIKNKKSFNKNIIVLSLGLALSACGGSSSDDKVADVIEVNSAPTISSTAVTTIESGSTYSYSLVAADADGDTLTMSATNLPAWLTFDSATGSLTGTPADSDAGDTAITLTVSDGTDEITQSFTVSVTVQAQANNAAVITSTGVTSATVGESYSYTLMATDADSDTLTMSTTVPGALSWLTFDDSTGILSGTPASGDVAATEITLTVNDGTVDTMQTFTITVADAAVENTRNMIAFEGAAETYAFNNFDGGMSTVMANPQAMGINTSNQVVEMQKLAGQPWGGSTLTLPTALTLAAEDNTFTMKVWSARAVPVLFKLEGINKEISMDHAGTGWENLSYDFADDVTGALDSVTVIFDLGTMGDAEGNAADWTFYYDEITTPATAEEEVVVGGSTSTTDFEADPQSYTFNDFDGGAAVVLANPDATGINTSAQVGQMTKSAGQTWGGSTMTLATPAAIPANSMITMKVWASRAVPVLVKFDDMDAERTANHTGSGWEELNFDFTGATSTSETRLTLIFDNGVMGDAASDAANWTFYFDDFTTPAAEEVSAGNFVAVGTPYDFEATGLGSDFVWAVFENDDNPALEFVANPASSTVNDSTTVAMFTARMAGQPWAGTETTAANTTPFTMDATNSIVKIMVYKSVISDVALKFSVGAAAQAEIKVPNTKINEWEELTFDFSSRIGMAETINIDSVIVFPEFTDGRAADTVSYFDNITFGHNE
ncbi:MULTISPECIES: putative Ig domain-containing protein [unclassified Colwellia]|uniref:putative Ig domain-containing protein n=1 Tax=unclassified Colwellia TaxID=196834 RepID=UPI0015F57955|nr:MULTISPECIES: putative Ig domain-containing protein [unclassified Colwellia]MBA6351136.1 putative Ig domain-containing protein [Colwellia sp. BRX9-1]MBA6355528.1 putative Ig domain-containing protein [Colwellia sp. BRX8-3]MBA6358536.1 putative Ig domain-containing protein [Colwellia sp. BRX8-6]MBA6366813.1 putative Ig domain-containing protein [Colwellia sp. BRX8-5]MBA6370597.1 putative Ig domain-containing protein [Colwellia sp. BRX8-4]